MKGTIGSKAILDSCLAAIRKTPHDPGFWNHLGDILLCLGKAESAAEAFYQALRLAPASAPVYSNLLYALLESPNLSASSLAEAHASFGSRFDRTPRDFANDPRPGRRLRVGYISDGYRAHAIPFFFESLLRHHDARRFEIICYSNYPETDGVTGYLKRLAHQWFDIARMGDDEAAALIGSHKIDILVELGGHLGDNRLGLLARKVAPIQVSTWDYPCTSGSRNIDYHLTDEHMNPPGSEVFYSEKLVRLPKIAMCYRPLKQAPKVSPLPAMRNGFVTFGAFHRISKITPASVELWANAMRRLPWSRLILHHLFEGRKRVSKWFRADVEGLFRGFGISPRRLRWIGALPQLMCVYQEVDLALDAFPYSGCTTTAESLWMGVPVITYAEERASSRHGITMLRAAGLTQFIAPTRDDFGEIAREWGGDLPALARLRRSLRGRVARCPLTDGEGYTWAVERAYRQMWMRWATGRHPAGGGPPIG